MGAARTLVELANGLFQAADDEDEGFGIGTEDAEDMRAHAELIARADHELTTLRAELAEAREDRDQFAEQLALCDRTYLEREMQEIRAQLAEAKEALRPFAAIICMIDPDDEAKGYAFDRYPDGRVVFGVGTDRVITAGDLRRARAVLAKLESQ